MPAVFLPCRTSTASFKTLDRFSKRFRLGFVFVNVDSRTICSTMPRATAPLGKPTIALHFRAGCTTVQLNTVEPLITHTP